LGENQSKEIEKRILLQSIDMNWKSHIQYLEQLRQVVGLRSYGQRDPLVEYKKEAFDLFSSLLEKLKLDYIAVLMNLKVIEKVSPENKNKETEILNNPKCLLILKKDQKISRNDRCEATGKKFKQCCGAL
jgi:preprotein translocase subunit SecA